MDKKYVIKFFENGKLDKVIETNGYIITTTEGSETAINTTGSEVTNLFVDAQIYLIYIISTLSEELRAAIIDVLENLKKN